MVTFIRGAKVIDLRKKLLVLQVPQLYAIVVVLTDLVDILVDGLETLLLLLLRELDLVHKVGQNLVAPLVEQLLEQLVFVVEVLHFDDERVNFLDFMNHVKVLLGLDGVQNSFALL